ncbi:hypothetical protein ACFQI7_27885 [Paenibacillus allorhizosphaerae]|uniref:Uncharacterized protein n=1 Tax=Paenibacillus allorhizosphaerae TaxID=2849866 RepID=A0ABM8VNR4_9BACL|nr:hypothetical protein [Paenibacillus allorhizosphaerae]CAG7651724.1 hypothetical protein PAECIP111802_05035 [Paenibacillus allorhizosphaerae]
MNIDWGTFFVSVPTTLVIVGGFFKLAVNSFIDNKFKERLETHKKELQLIVEANKFDYQRKIADFNLYTAKRHESYMDLYDKVLLADGYIRSLMGFQNRPDYREYGLEDLEKWLKSFNLLSNKIEEFKNKWTKTEGVDKTRERQELHREIGNYIRMVEVQVANLKLSEAKNYFLSKRLYFSDEVIVLTSAIIADLNNFSTRVEYLRAHQEPFLDRQSLEQAIENNLESVRKKIKAELSVGDYN